MPVSLPHPLLTDVRSTVASWEETWGAPDPREAAALADTRAGLAQEPPALWRHPHRTHITCSTFALSPDLTQVLLVHHAKGGFWVQPGGHPEEGDADVVAAGLRELREETGTGPAPGTVPVVLDLDHHALSGAFGHCASHLDLGVAVTVDPQAPLTLSEESHGVAWYRVDALPENLPGDFEARLARVLARLRR